MSNVLSELIPYMERDGFLILHHDDNWNLVLDGIYEDLVNFYKLVGLSINYVLPRFRGITSVDYEIIYKEEEDIFERIIGLTLTDERIADILDNHYVVFVPRLWEKRYES